jgi:PPOX class probable F420-dependent enzyme
MSEQARAFLSERRFAVLGTNQPNGPPHLSVMWYELQGDEIMMNTATGRVKDHNLRNDPRITLCMEDAYQYVALSGTVELIEDQEIAQADILRLAVRYEGEERGEQMAASQFRKQQRVTMRMRIERVTEHF